MLITRGLIIREPWIDFILNGQKTWEMRSRATTITGWFGLIRKGSNAVCGVARLTGCGTPLDREAMLASIDRHCIPRAMIDNGEVDGWTIPWFISDVVPLRSPVTYRVKNGAVTWVNLDDEVSMEIDRQLTGQHPVIGINQVKSGASTVRHRPVEEPKSASRFVDEGIAEPSETSQLRGLLSMLGQVGKTAGRLIGTTEITEGNLRNNHFYMRSFINRFPADTIGGSNKDEPGRTVIVEWPGGELINTDIDGEKKFFRSRRWIGTFFKLNRVKAGDLVAVYEVSPYRYRIEHIQK